MRKILAALVAAATLAGAAVATSGPAEARWGGAAAGMAVGMAAAGVGERAVSLPVPWSAARSPRPYAYGYYPYGYYPLSLLRPSLRVAALVEWLRLGARLR